MDLIDLFACVLVFAKLLMTAVGICFLISGLDDFFIDICFVIRSLYRRYFLLPKFPPLTEKKLLEQSEQHIAVMIPAWDESAVIRPMLENTLKSISYKNYTIFVGTCMWAITTAFPASVHYPPLLEQGSFLWYVLLINSLLFVHRVFMRAYCVYRVHSLPQALLSFPRMIWGNFINFLATSRAISQYIKYLKTGTFIKWDKTAHRYPSEAELASFRRKLGDLLLDSRDITLDQLNYALKIQQEKAKKLGEILCELGWLQPNVLDHALQRQ